jgi:hypothetical protein
MECDHWRLRTEPAICARSSRKRARGPPFWRTNETTEFPIFLEAAKFEAGGGRKIELLAVEAQHVIAELQPFQMGDSAAENLLWLLHELSRVDKHRSVHLIAVTLAPFLLVRGQRLDMQVSTPLVRGAVIGRFGELQAFPNLNPETKMEFHLNANVAFGEGLAANRLVVKVLQEISGAVEIASSRLAPFLGSPPPAS